MKFDVFLIKPFCYMIKKSRQKLKYLEKEKSFWDVAKKFLRPESAPLTLIYFSILQHLQVWFPPKGFTYLNKPAALFKYVWTLYGNQKLKG